MRIPIPQASAHAWESFRKTTQPKNIGLIFDRFVEQDWNSKPDKEAKKKALQHVLSYKEGDKPEIHHKPDGKLLAEWIARWTGIAKNANVGEPFTMKTDWRFVTGLGRKGPLETGFTFQRYGFPILPGSSVKGVARVYALFWLDEQVGKNEQLGKGNLPTLIEILEEESDEKFEKKFGEAYKNSNPEVGHNLRAIFGTKAASGRAIFFDAIPAEVPELKLDIVNPHYPDYYREGKPPTNWQSPIPSYFLTVAPGQEFLFAIGWRGRFDEVAKNRRDMAVRTLKSALQHLGAGAKTSAGYGYWNEVKLVDKK